MQAGSILAFKASSTKQARWACLGSQSDFLFLAHCAANYIMVVSIKYLGPGGGIGLSALLFCYDVNNLSVK